MNKLNKWEETFLVGESTPQWLKDAHKQIVDMPEIAKEIREAAMEDLNLFAKLMNPTYVYGDIHREFYTWLQEYELFGKEDKMTNNKLIMLPRAHLKSHMLATWCAWIIVRHPEVTMLYLSATADLAITQLYDIKNIMESRVFQKYFPEYIQPDSGKREKWSEKRIIIDHPTRKEEGVRDATISAAGLTTNTTGWHADIIAADDLVVPENAYTEDGRASVVKKTSQFTSIRNTGGFTLACGTRYHPADIYKTWKEITYEDFNDEGDKIDDKLVWDVKEHKVEEEGFFLWPRAVRSDGKAFGFDQRSLARIKAEYLDKVQFYAQYYNDPNDPSSDRISRDKFQYYSPRFLKKEGSKWTYKGRRLNVYAAVDFAFSLNKAADYTAIVVIGMDHERNIYVLDIDRFKSDRTIEYFKHIVKLHSKWNFRKIQAEVTVAQNTIVQDIKHFVKNEGLSLSVEEYRPSRKEGTKEERIAAVLEYRYENYEMWHFEGGWTQVLEDELILARPEHDDVKDALASAVSIAVAPKQKVLSAVGELFNSRTKPQSRFGGFST
tara:strand:+ start:24 stop:1673 length:1650 start_codon:yes stop_codon:yes gene_type:complete